MKITEFLNGHTIEDVRRNSDGTVTFYCDSGRTLKLHVNNNQIEICPEKIITPGDAFAETAPSERMNLLTAFQGFMIDYAHYDDDGNLIFVCQKKRHDFKPFEKQHGWREVRLVHRNGLIEELPPVSAKIGLPSLSIMGEQYNP